MAKQRKHSAIKAGGLTEDQTFELMDGECWLTGGVPTFADEAERKAAYTANRSLLFARIGIPVLRYGQEPGVPWGCRPDSWWEYEKGKKRIFGNPQRRREREKELNELRELGELLPGEEIEVAQSEKEWRAAYESKGLPCPL